MGIESFLIASSINAILAQRLVRIICPHCKEDYIPDEEELVKLGLGFQLADGATFSRGRGCARCHHTGYKGRCGIFELLVMTKDMKRLVLKTADANQIKQTGH